MNRTLRMLLGAAGCLAAAPPFEARAACSWVDSVTGWDGSLAWSYNHQATWSDGSYGYEGKTGDQLSATFELDVNVPGQAQGPMEGTMSNFGREDVTGVGAPSYTEQRGNGSFDAYAPPPPQVTLFLNSVSCTYTFGYGPELGANGTFTSGGPGGSNTVPGIVQPGDLRISPQIPIPQLPEPLTFSGSVDAIEEGTPPPFTTYYDPPFPASDSAQTLGDMQLGKASAQWAFQPTGYSHPLNDACAGASALSGISQDTTFASTAASDPTPSCGAGDRSVWFLVQAGDSGVASLDTAGSDYGTIVSVWPMAQPCGALTTQVACGAGSATWSAEAGQTYRVQITRGSGGGGSLTAVVSVPEPGAGAAGAACLALLALASRRARTA